MNVRRFPFSAIVLGAVLLATGTETGFTQPPSNISQEVRDTVANAGRAQVIVQLDLTTTTSGPGQPTPQQAQARRSEIASLQQSLRNALSGTGYRVSHEFANLPFVALDIDASALAALEAAGTLVISVFEDRLLSPSLAESVPHVEGDLAHGSGLNGAGTVVAVLDSGVDRGHQFFGGRVVDEACFATAEKGKGGDCPNGRATQTGPGAAAPCDFAPDVCLHGTHVAGIAVGAGPEFSGVAPGADLMAIQVFHSSTKECLWPFEARPCPRASTSDVVAALEYVFEARDQYYIAAVNMSLGGPVFGAACDAESPLFAAAIDNLRSVGIATIAASGNDSEIDGIAEPACVASAISVGAVDDYDEVAWFSNASADLDLLAPGVSIDSSVPGGGFQNLQGTSMATPHVAGAWAIHRQANPAASVGDALASFIDTGVPITDWRTGQETPRIRVGAALGIEAPEPVLYSMSPGSVPVYGPDFVLTVDGTGFIRLSEIQVNGVNQATTYVSDTQLTALIERSAFAGSSSPAAITVYTPAPGGGTSNSLSLDLIPPSLVANATTVAPGSPVTVTLANGPAGPSDWIALVPVGEPGTSYVDYAYIGSGVTEYTWTVNMPQTPGDYEFRLLLNNTYTDPVAVSNTVTVDANEPDPDPDPDPPTATLTPSATTAAPGEAVTVTLSGAPGGPSDWIALVEVGQPGTSYLAYTYVGSGVTEYTWTVNMPQTPGDYEFRLLLNNSYTDVAAVSPPVTVSSGEPDPDPDPDPQAATLTPDTTTAAPGEAVTVTLTGAPGGPRDWIALVPAGEPGTSYVAYKYVGRHVTDLTWTVNMPQTPGQYEFRLYLDNTYSDPAAVSTPVTVQ